MACCSMTPTFGQSASLFSPSDHCRLSARQALRHAYFKELRDADKRRAKLESMASPEPTASPVATFSVILIQAQAPDEVLIATSSTAAATTTAGLMPPIAPAAGISTTAAPSIPSADNRHMVYMHRHPTPHLSSAVYTRLPRLPLWDYHLLCSKPLE